MEIRIVALKSRISNQTKLRQFVRRFFGETICEASRHIKRLTRSTPCYKGSKSEIRGVWEGIGGSKISCRGVKKIAVPLLPAHFGTSDEWTCLIFLLEWVGEKNQSCAKWMKWNTDELPA
ncbi:hypothetical protein AVEN_219329-1 [Araneus ventricosus]|uniref:Uncharacterized protein n=1 Tax=Araneus ventricosus TaxID=182803 RepID=A0A4Y2BEF8_ARAVE|nr:hypothetical protein AVEN_219329-1 [Araneus ventricosus]